MRGLKAGRDELVKVTKRYLLRAPIILLVLCNRKRGAPFLRAVLSVLHEYAKKRDENEALDPLDYVFIHNADIINAPNAATDTGDDSDPSWGNYIYAKR